MTPSSLGQYFRSFLVKLSMIESQLGQMHLGGKFVLQRNGPRTDANSDEISFAVIIELKDDIAPTHSGTKV
jgi:mitotic spindle assembly checkpoint protein MAD2B